MNAFRYLQCQISNGPAASLTTGPLARTAIPSQTQLLRGILVKGRGEILWIEEGTGQRVACHIIGKIWRKLYQISELPGKDWLSGDCNLNSCFFLGPAFVFQPDPALAPFLRWCQFYRSPWWSKFVTLMTNGRRDFRTAKFLAPLLVAFELLPAVGRNQWFERDF